MYKELTSANLLKKMKDSKEAKAIIEECLQDTETKEKVKSELYKEMKKDKTDKEGKKYDLDVQMNELFHGVLYAEIMERGGTIGGEYIIKRDKGGVVIDTKKLFEDIMEGKEINNVDSKAGEVKRN